MAGKGLGQGWDLRIGNLGFGFQGLDIRVGILEWVYWGWGILGLGYWCWGILVFGSLVKINSLSSVAIAT